MCVDFMRTGGVVISALVVMLAVNVGRPGAKPSAQATPRVTPVSFTTSAQSAAAALPNIVGFRPGMPIQEAYNLLKAYSPKLPIQAGEIRVPEISDKPLPHTLQLAENGSASAEIIQLDITLPPGKQVVWKVNRRLHFSAGKEVIRANLMAVLREKYGQEFSFTEDAPLFSWFFDQGGQRVPQTGRLYAECHTALGEYNPELSEQLNQLLHNPYLPPRPFEQEPLTQRPCRSLIVVRAALERDGSSPDLIRGMRISVADVALAIRAKQATYELIANAQAGKEKEQLNKAQQQPKPKL